jgi:ABC-type uncharacterized transport system substrate-binding protein
MNRRQFVFTMVAFALLSGCGVLPNPGQPATPQMARVGILDGSLADDPVAKAEIIGLEQGLADLGYVDGQTIAFALRNSNSRDELLPELANELVRLPVNVIVTLRTPPTLVAQRATATIPIVFMFVNDPVGQGIAASLAHPGSNLTGVANTPLTYLQKELELLHQLVPGLSRVALVTNSSIPNSTLPFQALAPAANALSVQLRTLDMRAADDVEPSLAGALAWRVQAMINLTVRDPRRTPARASSTSRCRTASRWHRAAALTKSRRVAF